MAITLFSFNANASEINENTIKEGEKIENNTINDDVTNPRVRLTITVDFGRASRGCNSFGICSVTISAEISFFQATTNDAGKLVLEANQRGLETVRSRFGSNTITLEEDYVLPADTAKQLGLASGYTIRAGRYTLVDDGRGTFVTAL